MTEIRMCRPAEAEATRLEQEAVRDRGRSGDRKVILAVEKAKKELRGISPADLTGKKKGRRIDSILNSRKEIVEPVNDSFSSTNINMDGAIAVDEVAQKSIYNKPLTGESLQSGSTSTTRGMTGKEGVRRGRHRVKENLNEMLKV